jgi:hypothetical protein
MSISTNAALIAARFKLRAAGFRRAIRKGLTRSVVQARREQVLLLSGGEAPGDYPVPRRTGHLAQSEFGKMITDVSAVVGNRANYALIVHDGKYTNQPHGKRPFLQDAVDKVDVQGNITMAVRDALAVRA